MLIVFLFLTLILSRWLTIKPNNLTKFYCKNGPIKSVLFVCPSVRLSVRPSVCLWHIFRGGFRTAATSKMDRFVIIVNGFQPLTITTKRSILDVAAVLDSHLIFLRVYRVGFLNFYMRIFCHIYQKMTKLEFGKLYLVSR